MDNAASKFVNVILAGCACAMLIGLVCLLTYCEITKGQPFNITDEDGFIEWGTCAAFISCAIIALSATFGRKAVLAGRRRIFLIVFAVLCLVAVGEEISWGQRYFGFTPPQGMESDSESALRFGHNDVTWHNITVDLGFAKFSIGGALFSLPLLLGTFFHGVALPWAIRQKKEWAQKLIDKTGLFVPNAFLGLMLFVGTVLFHFRHAWTYTQSNEFKEFYVPAVYVLILLACFFADRVKPAIALLVVFVIGLAASLMLGISSIASA